MGLGDPYEGVVHPKGVATCVRTTALDGAACVKHQSFPWDLRQKRREGAKERIFKLYADSDIRVT